MLTTNDRELLRIKLIEVLRELPGAISLYEFGSGSLGVADEYSDIDLQMTTVSVANLVAGYRTALGEVAPIMLEWSFLDTPTSWASIILFDGVSPFNHLDLGFSIAGSEAGNPMFEGATLLWSQTARDATSRTSTTSVAPDTGSIAHMMIGEILGLIRYAKARRRRHDLLCWKFFSAIANRVLEVKYLALVDQNRGIGMPLTGYEHTLLREAMPAHDAHELAQYLHCRDADAMNRTVIMLGYHLVHACRHVAVLSNASLLHANNLLQWLASVFSVEDYPDAVY